jgi:methanogenic corrinoid protein MtbC1
MNEGMDVGRRILERRADIAAALVARFDSADLERGAPYAIDTARYETYAGYDVSYLAYALQTGRPHLLDHYVHWLHGMLGAHGLPAEAIVPATLSRLREAVHEVLGGTDLSAVDALLDRAVAVPPADAPDPTSHLDRRRSHAEIARGYLDRLVRGDRRGALALVQEATASGVGLRELYLDVFEPVQREVGLLWQTRRISVAREHFATSVTQLAMAQLYGRVFDPEAEAGERHLVAACIGDELHEIGLRMVADLAEMSGWSTQFFGANTPAHAIVQVLREEDVDVLALSCSMVVHVENVRAAIETIRAAGFDDLAILVGGYPFNLAPELHEVVGADGTAPDARAAVDLFEDAVA